MLLTLRSLRESLFQIETELAKAKADLQRKELSRNHCRAKGYQSLLAKGLKFKNAFELELAIDNYMLENLPNLESDIVTLTEAVENLKAKHAIRRREFREAELEANISGTQGFEVYDFNV